MNMQEKYGKKKTNVSVDIHPVLPERNDGRQRV